MEIENEREREREREVIVLFVLEFDNIERSALERFFWNKLSK